MVVLPSPQLATFVLRRSEEFRRPKSTTSPLPIAVNTDFNRPYIAEAYYGGVPNSIRETVFEKLDDPLAETVRAFEQRFQT